MRAERRVVTFIVNEVWLLYCKEMFELNLLNCLEGLILIVGKA